MRKSALLLGILLLSTISFAQDSPATMAKIEVRLQSPDVPEGSFAALPKIMYRSGTRYCRVEESADSKNGIHGLAITNEPDAWVVNLFTNTGRHFVDPGPTFVCHLPLFSDEDAVSAKDPSLRLLALEFGRELAFFKGKGATAKPGPILQTKETTAYELHVGTTTLTLFTYGPLEFPLAVMRDRGENHETYWYSGYGQVPFDAKLFAKPEGIQFEDPKP
jgi:hypothetical protein